MVLSPTQKKNQEGMSNVIGREKKLMIEKMFNIKGKLTLQN